jgi:catechol 2,3-dioxygenase-like lactoylglutathione lyase family enzyme
MANPRLPEFDGNSPLRPARFGHIVLRTSRYKEMAPWYKTVLNAEPLFEAPVASFLTFDDEHHRVLIIQDPRTVPRPEHAEGVAHWAYLFNSMDDLFTSYGRLKDAGITPTYCVNHGFQFSLYYHDPDKNEVELGCDIFDTREELNEWFANGLFAKNFYGFDFDPEVAYKRHLEGATREEIHEETYRGEAPDLSAFLEPQE